MKLKAKIMDEQAVKRALARISYEIVEHCKSAEIAPCRLKDAGRAACARL